jgi:2-methylfumaryl-CoA hydratase
MVHKKDHSVKSEINIVPSFQTCTPIVDKINIPTIGAIDTDASGGEYFFEDYVAGERLNHPEGITIDNSDHTLATKLYQNNAKVHFNDHMMKSTPMGQRLMYGGIVISMARAISFNGLQNAQWVYAINSGNHCNPTYAGDTIYAYTEVLETINHKREDIGLLRLRTVAIKNQNPTEISSPKGEDGKYLPNIVLDLDYTVVIPKKSTKK